MHLRNADPSYGDSLDAMQHWPEAETALAARLTSAGCSEVVSPFAQRGLVFLPLTPNPLRPRLAAFRQRLAPTGWCERWPRLQVQTPWAKSRTRRP